VRNHLVIHPDGGSFRGSEVVEPLLCRVEMQQKASVLNSRNLGETSDASSIAGSYRDSEGVARSWR